MKMGEKLQGLQEEKHQLFLQLKKVLHEEEKRRRKEQRYSGYHCSHFLKFSTDRICFIIVIKLHVVFSSDITTLTSASYQSSLPMHAGPHLLTIQGKEVLRCFVQIYLDCCHSPFDVVNIAVSCGLSQAVQSATVDPVRCLGNGANSCFQLL